MGCMGTRDPQETCPMSFISLPTLNSLPRSGSQHGLARRVRAAGEAAARTLSPAHRSGLTGSQILPRPGVAPQTRHARRSAGVEVCGARRVSRKGGRD